MQAVLNNVLTVPKSSLDGVLPSAVVGRFRFSNPAYVKNLTMGLSVYGVPKTLNLAVETPTSIVMPRGLLADLKATWPVSVVDNTTEHRHPFPAASLDPREYQHKAVADMLTKNQGLLVAGTGAGKTAMAVDLIAQRGQRALILVHTGELLRQWQASFKRFLGIDVGIIQGESYDIQPVTIAMMQSLKVTPEVQQAFGLVLVDECHRAPCSTIQTSVDQLPAKFRYGVTATPYRADEMDFMIHALLGPVIHKIEAHDLYACGAIIKPDVRVIKTESFNSAITTYNELLKHVTEDEDRNDLILGAIKQEAELGHSCLVLSQRVSHAAHLFDLFSSISDVPARFACGSSAKQDRIDALDDAREGRARVLFATKIADEGMDVPALDRLFLTCPAKAHGKVIQQMGRITRPFPGKTDAVVYDFLDDYIPMAARQYRFRKTHAYTALRVEETSWLPLIQ